MITVFRWIYFYTYLITKLKKFAKLYQLTSFSPLRISVPGSVEKNKANYPRLAIDMYNYFKKNLRVKIKSTIISNNVSFLEKYNFRF
jgi:hypothetical protein